ncbi:ABC transporter permease [Rhodococcoides kyotonense]|uniref:Peptide/nickel transport system permease protein n=1 Tax=Rhodococcoides kyotonense TaxID=398843 RepID=A0A239GB34_9NOCA|nr:ABC transporter permease [Rhodococcus kyotonensis]SNS66329.1 peptide/nickel transport system permease protein [Rhodococcus kyotonensis]
MNTFAVIKRVAQALLVVALSYTFVFYALFLLPGDPIQNQIDNPQNPLPEDIGQSLLAYYNLDKSGFEQYVISLSRAVTGDFGFSITTGRDVVDVLTDAIPETLRLASMGLVFAIGFALVMALIAVYAPWARLRTVATLIPALLQSTPSFLVGLILLQVFSFQLGWVSSIRDEGFRSLLLPALTLGLAVSPPIAQVLIQGLRTSSQEQFVTVLRSTGLSETTILARHVLKNASIPVITLLGITAGELLAGSVVTETIFNRSGIGFVTREALRDQDSPVILAVVTFVSLVFVTVSLVTDLVYPKIDPRIAGTAPSTARKETIDA